MSQPEPTIPEAKPAIVDVNKTALLVLDLNEACAKPDHPSHKLVPGMTKFLDMARAAGIPIIFTVSLARKGKPDGKVYSGFNKKPSEIVFFPDGFDKFTDGDLGGLLELYEDVDTLIITGCRSNICVLHTATTAARELDYKVVIPIDGLSGLTDYEEHYTLFHLAHLPSRAEGRFTFTELDMISFQPGSE
ncbi:cysteine hydrolase family protein [Chloroflexota bacterium]